MAKYKVSKIKTEHTIIDGIFNLLLPISELDCVKAITPGRIKQSKSHFPAQLFYTTATPTGLKLIAKSGRAVQEVFVVTSDMEEVETLIKAKK